MPNFLKIVLVSATLVALPFTVWAESSSSNFVLWGNAVTGGGNYSSSANFRLFQSAGDLSNQPLDSTNYHLAVGFEALYEEPVITMSVTPNVVTLSPDPLTTSSVSTAGVTVTVSTNADFGYSVTATEIADFANHAAASMAGVIDGTVSAGSEEYGIAVSGADAVFADDRSVSQIPQLIATRGVWGSDRSVSVTIKAAISESTDAGDYSGTIAFIGTANY